MLVTYSRSEIFSSSLRELSSMSRRTSFQLCKPLGLWPSDHMIRSRPLIGLSELCILDENSEDLQSHDGLLNENAEEVHCLHHNLQSHDGLLDENFEEVHNLHHNLKSVDGLLDGTLKRSISAKKNVFLTAIKTLSPWWELVHNLESPDEKQRKKVSVLLSALVKRFCVSAKKNLVAW